MKTFEIFFDDLNPEVQKDLIEAAGLKSPEEANWDVYPIAEISLENIDSNNDLPDSDFESENFDNDSQKNFRWNLDENEPT